MNAIIQTGNGLLWVGTESGLASFDGREFIPIDLHIAGAPHQGAVESLVEAANGDLWVGTHAGVVLIPRDALDQFDPKQLIYYQLSPGTSDEVESLYQTRDGAIWVGTNRGLYRKESGKFVSVISATSVNRIAESLDGHLLLITGLGFVEWDGQRIVEHTGLAASLGVHDDQIINVFQDRTGTMWYCTETGIVRRLFATNVRGPFFLVQQLLPIFGAKTERDQRFERSAPARRVFHGEQSGGDRHDS